jgi:hypothetical protein
VGSFAADYTAPDNTLLSDYTANDGTTFAAHASYAGHFYILGNRATTPSGGSGALSMASWVPASPDYSVTAGTYISTTQVSKSGPAFRIQPGAATFYYTRYRAGLVELMRVVNGVQSTAGSATYAINTRVGTTPRVEIDGAGGTITVAIDSVLMITATGETLIPGAGSAGMYWDNGTVGDTTGQLIADLAGEDTGAPSGISGDVAASLGTLATGATASVLVQGEASASLGSLAVAAQGGSPALQADASVSLGTLSATAAGAVAITGGANVAFPLLIVTATGAVLVQADGAASLGTLTSTAAGLVGDHPVPAFLRGTLTLTHALACALTLAPPLTGTLTLET